MKMLSRLSGMVRKYFTRLRASAPESFDGSNLPPHLFINDDVPGMIPYPLGEYLRQVTIQQVEPVSEKGVEPEQTLETGKPKECQTSIEMIA